MLKDEYKVYEEKMKKSIDSVASDFSAVREALEAQGLTFLSAEVDMIPQNTVAVSDEDTVKNITKMLEMLDDLDDVQDVYHNGELPEDEDEDE